MRELQFIAKQVEVTALSVGERLARIQEALHGLRDVTLTLHETGSAGVDAANAWFRAGGFGLDEHGYFERLDKLAAARTGDVDATTFTLYINDAQSKNDDLRRRVHAMRGLGRHLRGITTRMPGLAWLYYQDATGFALTYPMHDPCTVVPPDFNWHDYISYRSVQPDVNPDRAICWTPPNIDYGGKGLMVTASIPIYRDDQLLGVWSFDVPVTSLIEDSVVGTVVDGQESFIVDGDGILIAHSSHETLVAPKEGDVYQLPVADLGGGYANLDLRELTETGQSQLVDAEETSRYVVARSLPIHDWLLVATFPQKNVFQRFSSTLLEALAHAKDGNLAHRVPDLGNDTDQIVQSYNDMAEAVESSLAEKERTLRALESSRNHARALFASSPIGLALVDELGAMHDMNAELERQLGLNDTVSPTGSRPLITFNLVDAASAGTRKDLLELVANAIDDGEAGPVEAELTRSDQGTIPVRIQARRLRRDGVAFVLAGIEDITEQRKLQAQVLHKHKMEAIGTLAGGVAHDFNNLLTSIMGNASLLARTLSDLPDKKKRVDSIVLASERAAGLTAQLLAFSRRQMVQPRRLDLRTVVHQSERLLERLLPDNVELRVDANASCFVRADEGQLSQVVMNLVLNARDAVDHAGVIDLRLSARATDSGGFAVLEVTDNGIGMDADTRAKVFDPFFTTKTGGTGLGLSTVHDIIAALDGVIAVDSTPGKGTRFRIELPTCAPPHEHAIETTTDAAPDIPGVVVLVDDDASVLDVAAQSLTEAAIDVRVASNGHAALDLIRQLTEARQPISLVVTDVVMPGMGGRDLSEALSETHPDAPVMFMCGYTDDTILRHGIAADSLRLIRKPFTSDSFLRAVREAVAAACDD